MKQRCHWKCYLLAELWLIIMLPFLLSPPLLDYWCILCTVDIGPNPYVVDEGARKEFLQLPPPEQEQLGFHYFLFQKLQELVRSGDRTVARNKEKLAQELRRLAAKRGQQPQQLKPVVDYVQDVDEQAVEALARTQLELEFLQHKLQDELLIELEEMQQLEDGLKQELSVLLEERREKDDKKRKEQQTPTEGEEETGEPNGDGAENIKQEEIQENSADAKVKSEESQTDASVKKEEGTRSEAMVKMEEDAGQGDQTEEEQNPRILELQMDLGKPL